MCLIAFAWHLDARYPLVFAGNRDEWFQRPTAAAHWWTGSPGVLAGLDEQAGGTWCGVSAAGRIAALTNVRDPAERDLQAPSRGRLVSDYLAGTLDSQQYLQQLACTKERYKGFNLLLGEALGDPDRRKLMVDSNREGCQGRALTPGVYGISNAQFDTPWPKVEAAKRRLVEALRDPAIAPQSLEGALFELLSDNRPAADGDLPDTGVGLDTERALSPAFIAMTGYGTRASTVIILDADGMVTFIERSFEASRLVGEQRFRFQLPRVDRALTLP